MIAALYTQESNSKKGKNDKSEKKEKKGTKEKKTAKEKETTAEETEKDAKKALIKAARKAWSFGVSLMKRTQTSICLLT